MKQRRRIYYSAAQRSEIWDRWQAGEPMNSIGRRFGPKCRRRTQAAAACLRAAAAWVAWTSKPTVQSWFKSERPGSDAGQITWSTRSVKL
jgi:hypothetical protein